MPHQKKVVDLIYLDPPESEKELVSKFRDKIDFWLTELDRITSNYLEQNFDIGSTESLEFMEIVNMKQFIKHFLEKRLEWVLNSITEPTVRRRYITLLPPFPHISGVKRLLTHFFQATETPNKQGIQFSLKSDAEKEANILWDVYKLLKTVESADTILKHLDSENPFPSIFPVDYRKKCLSSTKAASAILFRKFIRPEKQPMFSKGMPKSVFSAESILERKVSKDPLIAQDMLDNLNYRNFFFSFYYYPTVKAKIEGKTQTVTFNYLDFELIKQEFLIDWINRRLCNNPNKAKIYEQYKVGGQSIAKIIEQNPKREIELLQTLPQEHFNDIMAQINENVAQNEKSGIDPFSENHGEYSFFHNQFKRSIQFTLSSIEKLKNLISSNKHLEEEDFDDEEFDDDLEDLLDMEVKEPKKIEYIRLKKSEITFPFFQASTAQFNRKLAQLRSTMDPALYSLYSKSVKKTLLHISESALLKRRTPKHEWVLPYLIKDMSDENPVHHLLILGAEVKTSQLGTSYAVGGSPQPDIHNLTCYFVYATDMENKYIGKPVSVRHARGVTLQEYDCANMEVQKLAFELSQKIMQQI